MPVNENNFLNSTINSFNSGSEIDYRNAISRSYYAVYHKSLSLLDSLPNFNSSHHAGLINYLSTSECAKHEGYNESTLKEISRLLKVMRKARNDADYNLDSVITKNTSIGQFSCCRQLNELWTSASK